MYNQDVLDLYPRVHVGARVTVTWQKFGAGTAVAGNVPDVTQANSPKKNFYRPVQPRRTTQAVSKVTTASVTPAAAPAAEVAAPAAQPAPQSAGSSASE